LDGKARCVVGVLDGAGEYNYYKVIQQNWGYGWDDVDFHETDSTYWPKDRKLFLENLKAYRENQPGVPLRVVQRKEKKSA